ncbi:MAG: hypothetical protein U9R58_03170 [Chloroflexota bacterium]|nr:hypothetical protein [Chloroflexota bacterium]
MNEPKLKTNPSENTEHEERKPYTKPQIIHELELEIRAGSPLDFKDPLDPFSEG